MKRILMICVLALFIATVGASEEYWMKIPYPNENIHFENIADIAVETSGTIWMCEFNKIYTYNNNKWTTFFVIL